MAKKQIEVVAAIIHDDKGRIFATQRGYGEWKDWWEFPCIASSVMWRADIWN